MIKAGDKVSFYNNDCSEWFNGTVLLICPKNYQPHQRVGFYIKPDEPEKLEGYLSKLSSKESLITYKTDENFDCIYDLENYADNKIFSICTFEGRAIKLLKSAVHHSMEDGCKCKSCKHFIQYAEPNQPDDTFVCFSCVTNPIRAYY